MRHWWVSLPMETKNGLVYLSLAGLGDNNTVKAGIMTAFGFWCRLTDPPDNSLCSNNHLITGRNFETFHILMTPRLCSTYKQFEILTINPRKMWSAEIYFCRQKNGKFLEDSRDVECNTMSACVIACITVTLLQQHGVTNHRLLECSFNWWFMLTIKKHHSFVLLAPRKETPQVTGVVPLTKGVKCWKSFLVSGLLNYRHSTFWTTLG